MELCPCDSVLGDGALCVRTATKKRHCCVVPPTDQRFGMFGQIQGLVVWYDPSRYCVPSEPGEWRVSAVHDAHESMPLAVARTAPWC